MIRYFAVIFSGADMSGKFQFPSGVGWCVVLELVLHAMMTAVPEYDCNSGSS